MKITNKIELEAAMVRRQQITDLAVTEQRDWNAQEAAELGALKCAIDNFELSQRINAGGSGSGAVAGNPLQFNTMAGSNRNTQANQDPERLVFRDTRTGQLVAAVEPGESIAPAASGGYDLNEPIVGNYVFNRQPGAALQQSNDYASGGLFVRDEVSSMFIDMARNRMACMEAGARSATHDGGSLRIARATGDPTAEWRGEGQKVEASQGSFETISVVPKFCACLVPFTLEQIEEAANSEQILRGMIGAAMGLSLDSHALRGPKAGAGPTGVRYATGVNLIDYATFSSPAPYAPITRGVRLAMDNNYVGDPSSLAWLMCPKLAESYDQLVDTTGQPLMPTKWAGSLKQVITNQIPDNLGAGTKTEVFIGDFSQMVFFFRRGLIIEVLRDGVIQNKVTSAIEHNLLQEYKLVLRASWRVDVILMRPNWLTVLHNHPNAI